MSSKCAKCSKTVYPVEKVNALEQAWHKGCFKCETCNLTLSLKTYKGHNKKLYCRVHYPTGSFTAVSDTPEMSRHKKNTSQQSSVLYTKDQKDLQGKKTSVADDPETARIRKNTKNQSMTSYHGLAGQRTQENERRAVEAENLAGTYREVGQPPQAREVHSLFDRDEEAAPTQRGPSQGIDYVAIYDYAAAADDEVSFVEGDIIMNGEVIDDGWMTGIVQRTGESGMLPSNYVEQS